MYKRFIKDYFTFSYKERRGIIVLIFVIFFILTIRIINPFSHQYQKDEPVSFYEEIDHWQKGLKKEDTGPAKIHSDRAEVASGIKMSAFDPNLVTAENLDQFGLSQHVKTSWIQYIKKGGIFHKNDDLKKIYGMDSSTFERLNPFIEISHTKVARNYGSDANISKPQLTEINNATAEDLKNLKGIGPVLAQRIIKYRNLLGGFRSLDQLTEVYGIEDSLVIENKKYLTLDKSLIKKINLNLADYRSLSRHPYISDFDAKAIIHYRTFKGKIGTLNELIMNNLLPDTTLSVLSDYLTLKEL